MMNILSLSDAAKKHRITIATSTDHAMKVYFPKQVSKFMELGNMLWKLILGDNSFFEEHDKAAKKVKFNNEVEVMPDKEFPVQSLEEKSVNESIQCTTKVEQNVKSLSKALETRVKKHVKLFKQWEHLLRKVLKI